MIPPTLDAFRALMEEASSSMTTGDDYCGDVACHNCGPTALIARQLQSLATATPAQLLGIVGVIRDTYTQDTANGPVEGWLVTPREGA